MRKKVEVPCSFCNNLFLKDKSEVNRNQKIGRLNYCSLKCSGKVSHAHLTQYHGIKDISEHCNNRKDEFTGFREFIRRTKITGRKFPAEISLEHLKALWEDQKGICPYSGIQLELPKSKNNNLITTASLDRIDSSKGYVEGNIQFVSGSINLMKNKLTHEQTIDLCKTISKHWK